MNLVQQTFIEYLLCVRHSVYIHMEMFIIEARNVFLADHGYVLPVYLVFRLLNLLPG